MARSPLVMLALAVWASASYPCFAQSAPQALRQQPAMVPPSRIRPEFSKYIEALGPLKNTPEMQTCIRTALAGNKTAIGSVMAISKGMVISNIVAADASKRAKAAPIKSRTTAGARALSPSSPQALKAYRKMHSGLAYCEGISKSQGAVAK